MKSLMRISLITLLLLSPFAQANGSKDPPPQQTLSQESTSWTQTFINWFKG